MEPDSGRTRRFSFIGVTTGQSAIMRVFPAWAKHLGLRDVEICGYDFAMHAPPESYREVVRAIASDPMELGGLVTTHKIDLFRACREMFDFIDPWAQLCGEVSSLSKRGDLFRAHAKDPISSGRSLDEFVTQGYWASSGAEVVLFGAGGSNLAISLHLMTGRPSEDRPRRIVVVNRSPARLESMRAVHEQLRSGVKVEYVHNSDPLENDRLLGTVPRGSLVVNGTGMGKDSPGSPITDEGVFPEHSLVWELNYRGELDFLHQAQRQELNRGLVIEDGWRYFVHGWTCVIEEVFDVEMTPDLVGELSEIALDARS
ncbi:MAG: shikimate dehydrogenase [Acidimicrobiales bacterium]|jgi:shikimate 5-dehydrogenase